MAQNYRNGLCFYHKQNSKPSITKGLEKLTIKFVNIQTPKLSKFIITIVTKQNCIEL